MGVRKQIQTRDLCLDRNIARGCSGSSGRVDRAFDTEAVDSGSIPGRVKPKININKYWFSQFPFLTFSNKRGQFESSTVWGRQIDRRQLNYKTARFLRCFLGLYTMVFSKTRIFVFRKSFGFQLFIRNSF